MCTGCPDRAQKLRDLVYRFETLADESADPLYRARLKHTAIDLSLLASEVAEGCTGCSDIAWLQPEPLKSAR